MGGIARDIKRKEKEMGAEWVFFYHIVELDAIPQEINASLASLVHNFPAGKSVLPHLAMVAFATTKDAQDLLAQLSSGTRSDHVKTFKQITLRAQMSAFTADADQIAPMQTLIRNQEKTCTKEYGDS